MSIVNLALGLVMTDQQPTVTSDKEPDPRLLDKNMVEYIPTQIDWLIKGYPNQSFSLYSTFLFQRIFM